MNWCPHGILVSQVAWWFIHFTLMPAPVYFLFKAGSYSDVSSMFPSSLCPLVDTGVALPAALTAAGVPRGGTARSHDGPAHGGSLHCSQQLCHLPSQQSFTRALASPAPCRGFCLVGCCSGYHLRFLTSISENFVLKSNGHFPDQII